MSNKKIDTKDSEPTKEKSFVGKVISPFKVKGVKYSPDGKNNTYDAKDQKSFDYLERTFKIKKNDR